MLEYGFIGRRELQRGLQVLRGSQEQFGVLVTGAGGGEDSHGLASKKLIVLHGELKWTLLLEKLENLFDQYGLLV